MGTGFLWVGGLWILVFGKQFLLEKSGKKQWKLEKICNISLPLQVDIKVSTLSSIFIGNSGKSCFSSWNFVNLDLRRLGFHHAFRETPGLCSPNFAQKSTKDWICLPLADGYCSQLSLQKIVMTWPLVFFCEKEWLPLEHVKVEFRRWNHLPPYFLSSIWSEAPSKLWIRGTQTGGIFPRGVVVVWREMGVRAGSEPFVQIQYVERI